MADTRRNILLIMAVFALEPVPFGAWLALIPYVKETLGLDKAQLALALLGMPIALIPSLSLASRLVVRIGPRRLLAAGFAVQAVLVFLPLLAFNQLTLFLALACFGVFVAILQVALNVYAGQFEKQTGRIIMNRCHGFWALGLTAGSFVIVLTAGLPPIVALALPTFLSAALGIWCAFGLIRLAAEQHGKPPARRSLAAMPAALFIIAAYALASSMTEGAMADWAAIYLAERLPDGAGRAGIAVTIFAGFLAAGRFVGDAAKVRFGVVALARATVACAIAGLLLLILPLPLSFAYLGFALTGLGASVGYPLAVSAVAALDDTYEGANIATLSMITVIGFLVGPPLIGFLADTFSLRVGLAALLPGLCVGFVLASYLAVGDSGASRNESDADLLNRGDS
ncbi:MFS transporter [Yoonia sp. SS1-5]|uniref:MFS transporter n=1 Tax=Yoonia rhodophyticola TaxID=3137370 RepID=A0AAN0MB35_9RHOB